MNPRNTTLQWKDDPSCHKVSEDRRKTRSIFVTNPRNMTPQSADKTYVFLRKNKQFFETNLRNTTPQWKDDPRCHKVSEDQGGTRQIFVLLR